MVVTVSLAVLIAAIAGAATVIGGLSVLLYRISRGARPAHSPAQIQEDRQREPLIPGDGGAAGAAAPAAADNHDDYPKPQWLDTTKMNVAVCGEVCVGKSTLVNFLCELPKPGYDKARTGRGETTGIDDAFEPRAYPLHLKGLSTALSTIKSVTGIELSLPQVLDLPGAGTCRVPAKDYIRRFGLRWVSSVILVVGQAIKELDVEIILLLIKFKVPFYVVQTKLDVLIEVAIKCAEAGLDDDQELDAESKRVIATQAVKNERARLYTTVRGSAGGPGFCDPERVFLVCPLSRERKKFPQKYGLSDDMDRLIKMIFSDAEKSYRDVAPDEHNAADEGIREQSPLLRQRSAASRAPADLQVQ